MVWTIQYKHRLLIKKQVWKKQVQPYNGFFFIIYIRDLFASHYDSIYFIQTTRKTTLESICKFPSVFRR